MAKQGTFLHNKWDIPSLLCLPKSLGYILYTYCADSSLYTDGTIYLTPFFFLSTYIHIILRLDPLNRKEMAISFCSSRGTKKQNDTQRASERFGDGKSQTWYNYWKILWLDTRFGGMQVY